MTRDTAISARGGLELQRLRTLKQDAQTALESIRAGFLMRRPFLAMIAMRLELVAVVDDRLRTAATNGRAIYFDARFLFDCSPEKRIFVFAHEVWHCALGHLSRAAGRLPDLWNIAIDHEVNSLLDADGFPMPEDVIHFPEYGELSAETVYERLLSRTLPMPPGFDLHLLGLGPGGAPPADQGSLLIDEDFHLHEAPPTEAQATRLRTEVARETLRRHGTLPGMIALELDRLEQSRIDWRPVLDRFIRSATITRLNWSRPQRRHLHTGLYLPSRSRDRMRVAIAIDTSGSVFEMAPAFIGEAVAILAQSSISEIDLMLFDTNIRARKTLQTPEELTDLLRDCQGGGGTDFRPLFMEGVHDANTTALFILTDGYGSAPKEQPEIPTLWVLIPDGKRPASWGELITLRRDASHYVPAMVRR